MKIAITIYPDDFAEADRIIHQLRGVRGLELDGYMGKASYEKNFDKSRTDFAGADEEPEVATASSNSMSEVPAKSVPRPNISPGEPSIGKIGTSTKDILINDIKQGHQPPQPKYTEHLKLLWKRGEVKYDGKEYYL